MKSNLSIITITLTPDSKYERPIDDVLEYLVERRRTEELEIRDTGLSIKSSIPLAIDNGKIYCRNRRREEKNTHVVMFILCALGDGTKLTQYLDGAIDYLLYMMKKEHKTKELVLIERHDPYDFADMLDESVFKDFR